MYMCVFFEPIYMTWAKRSEEEREREKSWRKKAPLSNNICIKSANSTADQVYRISWYGWAWNERIARMKKKHNKINKTKTISSSWFKRRYFQNPSNIFINTHRIHLNGLFFRLCTSFYFGHWALPMTMMMVLVMVALALLFRLFHFYMNSWTYTPFDIYIK